MIHFFSSTLTIVLTLFINVVFSSDWTLSASFADKALSASDLTLHPSALLSRQSLLTGHLSLRYRSNASVTVANTVYVLHVFHLRLLSAFQVVPTSDTTPTTPLWDSNYWQVKCHRIQIQFTRHCSKQSVWTIGV